MSNLIWGLDCCSTKRYNMGMKTKYTVCISAKAKDAMDRWRLENNVGRYPLSKRVHSGYTDNRTPAAKRGDKFSARIRPATVQTNLDDEQIVAVLELANKLDIIARYDTTDQGMISNLLGSFLDAVIMGDLVDTNAMPNAVAEINQGDMNPQGRAVWAQAAREYVPSAEEAGLY